MPVLKPTMHSKAEAMSKIVGFDRDSFDWEKQVKYVTYMALQKLVINI